MKGTESGNGNVPEVTTHTERRILRRIQGPYDFGSALSEYNIPPWSRQGSEVVRPFVTNRGRVALVRAVGRLTETGPAVALRILSGAPLARDELTELQQVVRWCLRLDVDPTPLVKLGDNDPLLRAALANLDFGRLKIYPTVLEGLVGVIAAQNTSFARVYSMMGNLCQQAGTRIFSDGREYSTFPDVPAFVELREAEFRLCKFGYRSGFLADIAQFLGESGLDLERLKQLSTIDAQEVLMTLPGVGPYTAALVASVGLGRSDSFHVDSYVLSVLSACYFKGRPIAADVAAQFAEDYWGGFKGLAIGALTTGVDIWIRQTSASRFWKTGHR